MKIKKLLLLGAIATLTPALAVVTSSCVNNTDKVEAEMGSFDVMYSNEVVQNAASLHFVTDHQEFKVNKEKTTGILRVGNTDYNLNVSVSNALTDQKNPNSFVYTMSFKTPDVEIQRGTSGNVQLHFVYMLHGEEKSVDLHKENVKIQKNETGISNFKINNTDFYANEENFRNAFEFEYSSPRESSLVIEFIKNDTTGEGSQVQLETKYINHEDGSKKASINLKIVDDINEQDEVINGHLKIFNMYTGTTLESNTISLNKFVKITPSFDQKITNVDFNSSKIDGIATISFNTLLDATATINFKNDKGWTAESTLVDNVMNINVTPKWDAESRIEKFSGQLELLINDQVTNTYNIDVDVKNSEIKASFEQSDETTFNSTQTELNLGKITLENTFKSDKVEISLNDESVWTLKAIIADTKKSADLKLVREVPTQKPVDFNGNLTIKVNGTQVGEINNFTVKYEAEVMSAKIDITATEFKPSQKIDNAGTVKLENVQKWDLDNVKYSLESESTDWKLDVKNDTISFETGKDEKDFIGTIICKVNDVEIGRQEVKLNVIKATTYTYTQTPDITFDSKTTTLNLGKIQLDNLRSENVTVELNQNDKWTLKFTFDKEKKTVDLTLDKVEAAELTADFSGKLTVKVDGSQIGIITDFTITYKA